MPFCARDPRRATGARPARPRPMTSGKQFACARADILGSPGQTFGLPGKHSRHPRLPGEDALRLHDLLMPFYARVPRRATGARPARPRPMTRGKQFACAGQTFGLPGKHSRDSRHSGKHTLRLSIVCLCRSVFCAHVPRHATSSEGRSAAGGVGTAGMRAAGARDSDARSSQYRAGWHRWRGRVVAWRRRESTME